MGRLDRTGMDGLLLGDADPALGLPYRDDEPLLANGPLEHDAKEHDTIEHSAIEHSAIEHSAIEFSAIEFSLRKTALPTRRGRPKYDQWFSDLATASAPREFHQIRTSRQSRVESFGPAGDR